MILNLAPITNDQFNKLDNLIDAYEILNQKLDTILDKIRIRKQKKSES